MTSAANVEKNPGKMSALFVKLHPWLRWLQ